MQDVYKIRYTMYDKVRMMMSRTRGDGDITRYLDNAKEQTDLKTGEVCAYGGYHGMRVDVYAGYVYITGSLAKFMHGSNVYTLDRHTTGQAIEMLGDGLHVDLGNASVTELEFGQNFIVSRHVGEYLQRLGDMPRMNRSEFGKSSLYYMGKGKKKPLVLTFYDKKADALAKGMALPAGYDGVNLLRYEMRLKGRLPYRLGVPAVAASTLSERPFYDMMVRRYVDMYFSIKKVNKLIIEDMTKIKTAGDAFSMLVALMVREVGQARVEEFMRRLKDGKVLKNRSDYTHLRKRIQEVTEMAGGIAQDELVKEMDDAVKNVKPLAGTY